MDFGRKFLSCNLNGRASLQHFLSLACCGAASDPAAMEEEWSDPETQDTEFKVHPPFIIGSCNIYSRVSWELDFRWEISPYHTFIYNTDMHFHTCIYVNISYKYTMYTHNIYIYIYVCMIGMVLSRYAPLNTLLGACCMHKILSYISHSQVCIQEHTSPNSI